MFAKHISQKWEIDYSDFQNRIQPCCNMGINFLRHCILPNERNELKEQNGLWVYGEFTILLQYGNSTWK